MDSKQQTVVILTVGKSDNGKRATLAFSCAMSALAIDQDAVVFLTSDGAVWGYQGSAEGTVTQGFPPLQELIEQFREAGGRLLMCSVCHRTCSSGGIADLPSSSLIDGAEIAGFATVLELAAQGVCVTF